MDAVFYVLPQLLFSALSALPLVLGMIAAVRHLRAGSRSAYLQNLFASIAGGTVALALLWSSLFGDSLSKSSTAGLIFAVAPVYAGVAQGIVHAVAGAFLKRLRSPVAISSFARVPLLFPLGLLAVLMFGIVNTLSYETDSDVARRTSDPKALRRFYEQSRSGQMDAFRVPLTLAHNPVTPVDILIELAKHEHPAVRLEVARNPRTPQEVVAALRDDCSSYVRAMGVERLGPSSAPLPADQRSGGCAYEKWR
jgi:hypothetical protein